MFTGYLDNMINLIFEAKAILNSSSPFKRVYEQFTGQKSLSQFIRNNPKFVELVGFNLDVDKDNKSDSIQYVPILSTLKVFMRMF